MSSAEAGGARWVVDVGDEDFEREVLERSRELPVVVDFWAPWCGPCRTLGPLLERLAEEHQGAFLLAKVDTDQAPYVAQGFGIRSIPTVMGFRDGEVVASFAGAQPEPALRDFLGQLLPSPADRSAREAEALRAAGDAAGAEALLRGALESEPRSGPALLALARLLMEREELEEAEALLERVVPVGKVAAERDQLAASLHIRRAARPTSTPCGPPSRRARRPWIRASSWAAPWRPGAITRPPSRSCSSWCGATRSTPTRRRARPCSTSSRCWERSTISPGASAPRWPAPSSAEDRYPGRPIPKGAPMISAEERYPKQKAQVRGRQMAYVEAGTGDPILFLHGNPTSSYLWRNVMPAVSHLGRCIAPDLIGMGDSEKLEDSGPERYRFVEHREYLDALLEALGVRERVVFVIHDWGSALGFDWANRHRSAVRGIAYMEAIVRPLSWADWPEAAAKVFQGFRSEAGEAMVLEQNVFVERVLPGSVLRKLSEAEMEVYRRPFREPGESRRPTLTWPRQIPIDGEPPEVADLVKSYAEWLAASEVPKLFVNADPGAILTGEQREFCRSWPNQRELTVSGSHFIQEDSPDEIGRAVADFVRSLP